MSLFKQMAITFTLFLALVLTSVMALNFNTATEFTQHQLYTEAKNTAHSLGLSLAKATTPDDLVLMETMINAIFDSGYYERIALVSIDNTPIYVRETKVLLSDVPQWFINAIELESVSAYSDIMMGWHQFGVLEVKGHTGNAYRQLYQTFWELCKTFALFGVLVFGVLYALLSLSLQSLKRIANQARAIIDNAFIIEKELPFTTEFRSTTKAMNAMVEKVKDIFDRENETLKRYHELLYIDAQTKLYNRRYISTTLPDYLHEVDQTGGGVYVLLSIDNPDRLKKNEGYERYTQIISTLSAKLNEHFPSSKNALIGRLNEGDFFVFLPTLELEAVTKHTNAIMETLRVTLCETCQTQGYLAGCSVGVCTQNETPKTLFSRADYGVMHSKNRGDFSVHVDSKEEPFVLGRDAWRETLLKGIESSAFALASQKVLTKDGEETRTLHEELFLRWMDPTGVLQNAGHFIPIAIRLGIMDTLDRHMIEKAILHVKNNPTLEDLAINLSESFLCVPKNLQWLESRLKALSPKLRKKIWVEIHNTIALCKPNETLLLAQLLKRQKCHFGLDHFTMPPEGAHYLQTLRPDYLKASGIYLHDMFYTTQTGAQPENLANLLGSLGITLIATNIETLELKEALVSISVSHFQGRYIASVSSLVP